MQAQLIGVLINRRHVYSSDLRLALPENYRLRVMADHQSIPIPDVRALRALQRAEAFVAAVARRQEA